MEMLRRPQQTDAIACARFSPTSPRRSVSDVIRTPSGKQEVGSNHVEYEAEDSADQ